MASNKAGGKPLSPCTNPIPEVYTSFSFHLFLFLIVKLHNYPTPPPLPEPSLAAEFPRDFLGVSVPEQPNKYYFIIRGQRIVLEADSSIQTIMEKLQSYKTRIALNFDVCTPPLFSLINLMQISKFVFCFKFFGDTFLGFFFFYNQNGYVCRAFSINLVTFNCEWEKYLLLILRI